MNYYDNNNNNNSNNDNRNIEAQFARNYLVKYNDNKTPPSVINSELVIEILICGFLINGLIKNYLLDMVYGKLCICNSISDISLLITYKIIFIIMLMMKVMEST